VDISTMLLALALGNLSVCAALFFFDHGRARSAAMRTWGSARQLQAAAWLLLYLRLGGILPDALAIPLGYCLLFFGVALEAGALWEADGKPQWRRATLWALVLAVGVFLACFAIDPGPLRQLAGALILGVAYLSSAAAFASGWRGASMLRRFLALAVGVLALLVAARGVLVLVAPGGWGWISNGLLQLWSSAAFYLLMLLGAVGFLLLGRERLQHDIERLEVVDIETGLANRRGLFLSLAPWLALARRPGLPTAWSCSSSTTSSGSTTATATPPATPRCAPSSTSASTICATATSWAAWLASNSPSCYRAPDCPPPRWWLSACAPRWRRRRRKAHARW
jgi:hypothetical protein